MGLVFRINLLITVLLLALLGAALLQTALTVRATVLEEVRSQTTASLELISAVATDTSISEVARRQLIVRIANIVDAEQVAVEHRTPTSQFIFRGHTEAEEFAGLSPGWFVRLLSPPERPEFMHVIPDSLEGRVLVMINPANKIEEEWRVIKPILYVLGGFIVLCYALVFYSVRTSLRPVSRIVAGLEQLARGDYRHRLQAAGLSELRTVSHRINALAEQLERSETNENRLRLAAIDAQEAERHHLARELHDEFGQSLTAIKALSAADDRAAENPSIAKVIPERRVGISQLCDHLQGVLRGMMRQLRPVALDEFGLTQALQQLVDDWNEVDDSVFCSLSIRGNFNDCDDTRSLTIYRMIQECLTNTRKHANASQVTVTLTRITEPATLQLRYDDDGNGFSDDDGDGYGLRGLRDRVRALYGDLKIDSGPGQGFRLHCELPGLRTED